MVGSYEEHLKQPLTYFIFFHSTETPEAPLLALIIYFFLKLYMWTHKCQIPLQFIIPGKTNNVLSTEESDSSLIHSFSVITSYWLELWWIWSLFWEHGEKMHKNSTQTWIQAQDPTRDPEAVSQQHSPLHQCVSHGR